MKMSLKNQARSAVVLAALAQCICGRLEIAHAATFSNAWLTVGKEARDFTPTNINFTVSFWMRIAIPSSEELNNPLTILMDRADGNEASNFAYLFRYDPYKTTVEFMISGSTGTDSIPLITKPYMERWYHLAVARQGEDFSAYVDGKPALSSLPHHAPAPIGEAKGDGLIIGGSPVSPNKAFWGDVVEVAFYQACLDSSAIQDRMFKDQRTNLNITGYFKLGYSTNAMESRTNFAPVLSDLLQIAGSGTISFEETDEAGEQSAFDSRKNSGNDAIAPLSGAFVKQQTALSRPTPGIPFEFIYGYNSAIPTSPEPDGTDPYNPRVLGPGWRHTFEARLVQQIPDLQYQIITWDGSLETWIKTNNVYKSRHSEYRGELVKLDGGGFEWTTPQRIIYRFGSFSDPSSLMWGRLLEIRDFNTNHVRVNWRTDEAYITSVIDSAGGQYDFAYDTANRRLLSVAFQGWQVTFGYDPNSGYRLTSKTLLGPVGYTNVHTTWQFSYNTSGLLERLMDPLGNTNAFVQYDHYSRRTNEINGLGHATTFAYGVPAKRQITRTDPKRFKWVEAYDARHRLIKSEDPLGNVLDYSYDVAGNLTSLRDPMGFRTTFGYDDRANMLFHINALGEVRQWTYPLLFNKPTAAITPQPPDVNGTTTWTNSFDIDTATGNLLRHYDLAGTLVRYSYSTNGLVSVLTDANNHATRFGYDTNGFLTAITNAAGFVTRYGRNEWGWLTAETNAIGLVTTYSYDLNGNVVQRTDPLNRSYRRRFDANGNLVEDRDAKGQLTRYAWNALNQPTQMVDRAKATWSWAHTERGQIESFTDPLGNTTTHSYDSANRRTTTSYPLGFTSRLEYDRIGRVTNSVDQAGRSWRRTYDRLGREISVSDPIGNTRRIVHDPAGRISQIRSPKGASSVQFYDGRGRLRRWVDAAKGQYDYAYDAVGNLTNVTDAIDGRYAMGYGPRNERLWERDQQNHTWRYEYDPLLRLRMQTDPRGITNRLEYDVGGRLTLVAYSSGRVNSLLYDLNDNPEVIARSVASEASLARFTYDAMDRVIEYREPNGNVVGYQFDDVGRLVCTLYPGSKLLTNSFDALGRITNTVFFFDPANTFFMAFRYDALDRIVWRTYPNNIMQTNTYDAAGRITGLEYGGGLSLGLAYVYDLNGNKASSTEWGTLDRRTLVSVAERSEYIAGQLSGRDISPLGTNLTAPERWVFRYDAAGSMTSATNTRAGTNIQSMAISSDEDGHIAAVHWDCSLSERLITNHYDALGRRVAKEVDTVKTCYVLDLAGMAERVLCDATPSGLITAWYVHAPDLAYRVSPDGSLLCYHPDALLNVIAATDKQKSMVTQYAYTPYGLSLGETNVSSVSGLTTDGNPYRFVGAAGVMEEVHNIYFMRARYYSAEAAVFLSVDPVRPVGPSTRLNFYSYASGNPLSTIDPQGLWAINLGLTAGNTPLDIVGGLPTGGLMSPGVFFEVGWQARTRFADGPPRTLRLGATADSWMVPSPALGWTTERVQPAVEAHWRSGEAIKAVAGVTGRVQLGSRGVPGSLPPGGGSSSVGGTSISKAGLNLAPGPGGGPLIEAPSTSNPLPVTPAAPAAQPGTGNSADTASAYAADYANAQNPTHAVQPVQPSTLSSPGTGGGGSTDPVPPKPSTSDGMGSSPPLPPAPTPGDPRSRRGRF